MSTVIILSDISTQNIIRVGGKCTIGGSGKHNSRGEKAEEVMNVVMSVVVGRKGIQWGFSLLGWAPLIILQRLPILLFSLGDTFALDPNTAARVQGFSCHHTYSNTAAFQLEAHSASPYCLLMEQHNPAQPSI